MNIVFEKDKAHLMRAAAAELSRLLALYRERAVLLLLAGGSSFQILEWVDTAEMKRVTIGMFDERFSSDPVANNFSQLAATGFYKKAHEAGAAFLNSVVQANETLETYAARLEAGLKKWVAENPDGKVLATFGIGEDGHTGGMMPFPENPARFAELFESGPWVAGYDAGVKNPQPLRVSATMTFIRAFILERVVFAAGEGKKQALARVLAPEGTLAETPARIHRDADGAVLFTDFQA